MLLFAIFKKIHLIVSFVMSLSSDSLPQIEFRDYQSQNFKDFY